MAGPDCSGSAARESHPPPRPEASSGLFLSRERQKHKGPVETREVYGGLGSEVAHSPHSIGRIESNS